MLKKFEAFCDLLRKLFSDPLVYITFVCLALLSLFLAATAADPDLFARMAVGRLISSLGHMPLQDPFAFTPRKAIWVDHEWLSGVIFFYVNLIGGDFGLFLLKFLFACATVVLLANAQRIYADRHSGHFFWLLICTAPCAYLWTSTVRAQIFTWLFLPFFVFTTLRFERRNGSRLLALLPVLTLIWVNAHGGFILGLGYLLLFLLKRRIERGRLDPALLLSFLLCCLATLLTPYTPAQFWSYLGPALLMPRPTIGEWQAIGLLAPESLPLLITAAIVLTGFYRNRKAISPFGGVLLLISLAAAFRSSRLAALFLFTALVFGSQAYLAFVGLLDRRLETRLRRTKRAGALLAGCFFIFFIFETYHFLRSFRRFSLDYSAYPQAALLWLKDNHQAGRLLVDFNLGSYALWKLYPDFLVSLDGRYEELYPDSTMHLVSDALNISSPSRPDSLDKISPDFILLNLHSQGAEAAAAYQPAWTVAYRDMRFAILRRSASDS